MDYMVRKLDDKNTENEKLSAEVSNLSAIILKKHEDESLHLKSQFGSSLHMDSEEGTNTPKKPEVLLVGTSNVKDIK
jgi:hypothetical protein